MAFATGNQDDTMADINITPFTDVLLVLLIIFMLSATAAVQNSFKVNLPTAASVEKSTEKELVTVSLADDGHLYVNGQEVTEADLGRALKQAHDDKKVDRLLVMADKKVAYERIVAVMDQGKQAGFTAIGLATRPK